MANLLIPKIGNRSSHTLELRPPVLVRQFIQVLPTIKRVRIENTLYEDRLPKESQMLIVTNFLGQNFDISFDYNEQFVSSLNKLSYHRNVTYAIITDLTNVNEVKLLHSIRDPTNLQLVQIGDPTTNIKAIQNVDKLEEDSVPQISTTYIRPTNITDWMIFNLLHISKMLIFNPDMNYHSHNGHFLSNQIAYESWMRHITNPRVDKKLSPADRVFPPLSDHTFNSIGLVIFLHHSLPEQTLIIHDRYHDCQLFENCIFSQLQADVKFNQKGNIPVRITFLENALFYIKHTALLSKRSQRFAAFLCSPLVNSMSTKETSDHRNDFSWLMFRQSSEPVNPIDIIPYPGTLDSLEPSERLRILPYINLSVEPTRK